MCSPTASTGFYLTSHGVSLRDLSGLPRTLGGLPKGCVQRLSAENIITRGDKVWIGRGWRVMWYRGHNWNRLEKWMREHEYG